MSDPANGFVVLPDGGLTYGGGADYTHYTCGADYVTLDGMFDAAQLRWLADYIERHADKPVHVVPEAPKPQLSGDACRRCGNFSLVRTGTCMTCQECGETSGCS